MFKTLRLLGYNAAGNGYCYHLQDTCFPDTDVEVVHGYDIEPLIMEYERRYLNLYPSLFRQYSNRGYLFSTIPARFFYELTILHRLSSYNHLFDPTRFRYGTAQYAQDPKRH